MQGKYIINEGQLGGGQVIPEEFLRELFLLIFQGLLRPFFEEQISYLEDILYSWEPLRVDSEDRTDRQLFRLDALECFLISTSFSNSLMSVSKALFSFQCKMSSCCWLFCRTSRSTFSSFYSCRSRQSFCLETASSLLILLRYYLENALFCLYLNQDIRQRPRLQSYSTRILVLCFLRSSILLSSLLNLSALILSLLPLRQACLLSEWILIMDSFLFIQWFSL